MTVKQLMNKLKELPQDKVVVISEPDQIGWANIDNLVNEQCQIKIVQEREPLFSES